MCTLLIITSVLLHVSMNKDSLETVAWSLSSESSQLQSAGENCCCSPQEQFCKYFLGPV